jgi:hypothetical protein
MLFMLCTNKLIAAGFAPISVRGVRNRNCKVAALGAGERQISLFAVPLCLCIFELARFAGGSAPRFPQESDDQTYDHAWEDDEKQEHYQLWYPNPKHFSLLWIITSRRAADHAASATTLSVGQRPGMGLQGRK